MVDLFIQGGTWCMSLITLELIVLLVAVWLAPKWIKEIGKLALLTGFVFLAFGLYNAFGAVMVAGDVSNSLVYGAAQMALIPIIYGMLVYGLSLILRMFVKSRE